jgi:hypothetical protein
MTSTRAASSEVNRDGRRPGFGTFFREAATGELRR